MTTDTSSSEAAVEDAVVRLMMGGLVDADLNSADPWVSLDAEVAAAMSSLAPGPTVDAVLRVAMLMEQVLVELATRASLGQSRSEVIAALSRAVHCVIDAQRSQQPGAEPMEVVRRVGVETWRFGSILVDASRGVVWADGKPVDLTAPEMRVLAHLVLSHDRVVSETELHHSVWSNEQFKPMRVITTVRSLRTKLGDSAVEQRLIRTAWGRGYRLAPPVSVHRQTECDQLLPPD